MFWAGSTWIILAEQYRIDVEQPIYGSMRRVRAIIICSEIDADPHHSPAGQFTILDDSRPQVITVDFPAPPTGVGKSQKLVEHGTNTL